MAHGNSDHMSGNTSLALAPANNILSAKSTTIRVPKSISRQAYRRFVGKTQYFFYGRIGKNPQTPIVASRLCDDHSPDRSNNLQEFEDNHRSENTGPDAGESDESESATTVDEYWESRVSIEHAGNNAHLALAGGQKRSHEGLNVLSDQASGEPSSKMRRTSTWSQSSDSSSAVRNVRIFHGESDNTTRGRAVLDTGASANFISKDMASKLQVQQQGYRGQLVSAANGSPVRTNSTMTLDWYFIGFENLYKDQFLVAEDLQSDIIIGMKTLQKRELLYWNEKLCVLTFERLSKDEKKTQDEAEAKKAEKNKEDEEKRLQEKIKKAKQGRG